MPSPATRFLRRFRRLRWKLTLSYTLVTVAALVVMEVLLFGALGLFLFASSFLPRRATQVLQQHAAPQVRPFLRGAQPDREALTRWLQTVYAEGVEIGPGQRLLLATFSGGGRSKLVVVDANGRFLASMPADLGAFGRPFADPDLPEGTRLLRAALAGETNPDRLFLHTPNGRIATAVPVFAEDGRVLGALYFAALSQQPGRGEFVRSVLGTIGLSAVVFTVAAALLGTLFGFLTARGLTRRLGGLAEAADAWSRGDLSVVVRDPSDDELGQLARRLNRMAEQLRSLLQTRQQLAAMEERNRLARDLHDAVKQQLFATVMQVGAAREVLEHDPRAAARFLAEAERLGRQAQEELTALIWELRPAALADKDLATALRDYVAAWSQRTGIAGRVQVQGEPAPPWGKRSVPPPVEQALFRVAQEALTNVARHSGATAVDLHLVWGKGTVLLTVRDNGQGFDLGAVGGKGLGLRSMRERVEALGGDLVVESRPGEGTWVMARCPLPPSGREDDLR